MPLTLINPITYTDTTSATQSSLVVPTGTIISSVSHTTPTGFLICDGSNTISRTTYSSLFSAIVPSKGTVTITIATPGVVTLNSHNFLTGESIFLTTTGALPTGLSIDTLYYIISVDANTFRLATSYANAVATSPTPINTSGTQSGTHTLFYCPYGLGSTTSNFKLPDFKNATIRGRGLSTSFTNNDTTRMGNLENDSFQAFQVGMDAFGRSTFFGSSLNNYALSASVNDGTDTAQFSPSNSGVSGRVKAMSDGTNGTPRTTTETRMKNQGVNFFIKF